MQLPDVQRPVEKGGGVWRFEVRFGEKAVSRRLRVPPISGMVQVNLDDDFTRTVMAS